jgi:hypothetical protein
MNKGNSLESVSKIRLCGNSCRNPVYLSVGTITAAHTAALIHISTTYTLTNTRSSPRTRISLTHEVIHDASWLVMKPHTPSLHTTARSSGKSSICYNVLGKRAGQASEPVKISPTLPSTINYRSNIGDIETKQLVLQTTELNSMSNFTTLATLW